ncbi:hypothetical protein GGTG_03284 [Gaeumannomyces tritici R3-111a-1]|uniref:Uncharacterized protein n=1 Tax=Gaeumannomyces tritici (strain R3-111a-1) TaxID=644352 RepID=J3NPS7_GAET3|nr:hypothetical protein GGTG_03284 [Gaeumannomyces tritici R3-111a-1]EJT78182.1 hypothetical protein GGTG_03284 [Gaeumannomyces tritici R3-111a-1]
MSIIVANVANVGSDAFCAAKQHFLLWGMVIIQATGYQTAQNDYSRLVGYLSSSGAWYNMALWLSKASIFCTIQGYPAGRQSWAKVTKCGIYALMCLVFMKYRCQTETLPPHRPLTCSVQHSLFSFLLLVYADKCAFLF